MPETFKIKATKETPEIIFNHKLSIFKISGRSMPEDAFEFYKPAIHWLEDYSEDPLSHTQLEFCLEYMNSGTVKQMFTLLCILEEIMETGKEVKAKWCHHRGDELIRIKGHEFAKFLDVPFEIIEL